MNGSVAEIAKIQHTSVLPVVLGKNGTLRRRTDNMRRERVTSQDLSTDTLIDDDSSAAMEEFLQSKIMRPLQESIYATDEALSSNSDGCVEINGEHSVVCLEMVREPSNFQTERIENLPLEGKCDEHSAYTSYESHHAATHAQSEAANDHPVTPPSRSLCSQSMHSSSSSSQSQLVLSLSNEQKHSRTHDTNHAILWDIEQRQAPSPPHTFELRSVPTPTPVARPKEISFSNPFTNYSPQMRRRTTMRREIMGVTILTHIKPKGAHIRRHPCVDSTSRAECSEKFLEMASQQIRTKMLQTEMTELAQKAERAADNGEDSFAAKPCAFQNDIYGESVGKSTTTRSYLMHKTQSTGLGISKLQANSVAPSPILTSSGSKLSIVELRDASEVFPSFRQFHTHLRTHLFRSHVLQDQLLFDELKKDHQPMKTDLQLPAVIKMASHQSEHFGTRTNMCRDTESTVVDFFPLCVNENPLTPIEPQERKQAKETKFLKHPEFLFDFGSWTQQKQRLKLKPENQIDGSMMQSDASASFVGDLLSTHITYDHFLRPKIFVPPGLEAVHVSSQPSYLRPRSETPIHRNRKQILDEAFNDRISSPPPKIHHVFSLPSRLDNIQPTALFDFSDYDSTEGDSIAEDGMSKKNKSLSTPPAFDATDLLDPSLVEGMYQVMIPKQRKRQPNSEGISSSPIPVPEFVTPVHLRTIRENRIDLALTSMILPSNSLAEESPLRINHRSPSNIHVPVLETVLDASDSLNLSQTSCGSRTIILPAFSKNQQEVDIESSSTTSLPMHFDLPLRKVHTEFFFNNQPTSTLPLKRSKCNDTDQIPHSLSFPPQQLSSPSLPSRVSHFSLLDTGRQRLREATSKSNRLEAEKSIMQQEILPAQSTSRNDCRIVGLCEDLRKTSVKRTFKNDYNLFRCQSTVVMKEACVADTLPMIETGCRFSSLSQGKITIDEDIPQQSSRSTKSRHKKSRKSIRAAMNMISKFSHSSPKERAVYVRTNENDAFMNNFLYCSRPSDSSESRVRDALYMPCTDANFACGDVGPASCCTSFFENSFLPERVLPKYSSNHPLVKLSDTGIRASRRFNQSWLYEFDDRFDCGLDPWTWGGDYGPANPSMSVSFQAPSLKSSKSKHSLRQYQTFLDKDFDDVSDDDEDKFHSLGIYDI